MKGHFDTRKKKIHSPSIVGAMKTVRVDARTEIMVPATLSDADAIERYHARIEASQHTLAGFKSGVAYNRRKAEESEEVPQEVLASVEDDSVLPDEE